MGQVQEDELKTLYAEYGEAMLKLEFYQNKCIELKNKILVAIQGKAK